MRWWFDQMRQAAEGEKEGCCAERFGAATAIGSDRGEDAPAKSIRQERDDYECIDKIQPVQDN